MILGAIMIIIGVLYLLREMGFIQGDFWGYLFPVLLILFGISLVGRKKGGNKSKSQSSNVIDHQ